MVLSKQEAKEIKEQLLLQVEKLPSEEKERIKKYIESLDEQQLEEFLIQNKIEYKSGENTSKSIGNDSENACIFCSIIKNEIPSYKIQESKKEIAILEINPLSKGHLIIVPIKHGQIEEIPKSSLTLAQKIAKRIKKKLKPDDIKIETTSFMGHSTINIIPIYKDILLKKSKAEESELKLLQDKLRLRKRKKRKQENKNETTINKSNSNEKKDSKIPKIGFRIP